MYKFLAVIISTATLLAGCERVEVVEKTNCTKIVTTKYYQQTILGISIGFDKYYVLSDGRELREEDYWEFKNPVTEEICTTEWVKKPNLNLKDPPAPQ